MLKWKENTWRVKLNDEQVRYMRYVYETYPYTHKYLATMFGISIHQVCRILRRECWKHVL